jgi:beta,beta-carotene 9',10'-dioxygenase
VPDAFALGFGATEREYTAATLPVRGTLPEWLRGTLIRNGPGTFRVGSQQYRHWFDGLAMLHAFTFGSGRVSYANRFLGCKAHDAARATGRISYSEFATDPCRSLFARVMAVFRPEITDSAKVNVARLAGRYLALAETPIQVEFDPETLASVGVFAYEPRPVGQMTTVHPQVDAARGETVNLVTRYGAFSQYRFYRLAGTGAPTRAATLRVSQPAYLHSFGMSRRYLVLAEFPLVVRPVELLLWLRPYIENFRWVPRRGTRFHVIDRATGARVARFEADPCFAFHHVNAWEDRGELVVDLVAYDDAGIIQSYYLQRLSDAHSELPWGTLRRVRLPLGRAQGRVDAEVLSETCLELPRVDERRHMDAALRYVYGVSVRADRRQGFYNQLVKVDVQRHAPAAWYEDGCYPGEPVFIASPSGVADDDGVVVSVVLDERRGTSFLLVLDAATFTERARAEIPHAVLFGYHGAFFDGLETARR